MISLVNEISGFVSFGMGLCPPQGDTVPCETIITFIIYTTALTFYRQTKGQKPCPWE